MAPAPAPAPSAPAADAIGLFRVMAATVAQGARGILEQRLSTAMGRPVKIEKLEVGPAGLVLTGVTAAGAAPLVVREITLASPAAPEARFRDLSTTVPMGGKPANVRVRSGKYDFNTRRLDLDGGTCSAANSFDFSGDVEFLAKQRARFAVHASGLAVAGGRASVDLRGTAGRGLDALSADGSIRLDGLLVDVSRSGAVAKYREQVQSAGVTARALDDLARGSKWAKVTGQMRAQTDFYGPVLDELSRPHRLSRVSGPVSLRGGTLRAPRLSGDSVNGRATVNFAAKRLDAHLDRVQLGRVTVFSVGLAGSLAKPAVSIDRKNVRLDGRPAPTSSASRAAEEIFGARQEKLGGGQALRLLDALLNAGRDDEPPRTRSRRGGNLERLLRAR